MVVVVTPRHATPTAAGRGRTADCMKGREANIESWTSGGQVPPQGV